MAAKRNFYLYDCSNCIAAPGKHRIDLASFGLEENDVPAFLISVPRLVIPGGPLCDTCWDEIVESNPFYGLVENSY